jgi:hypothetical protein
MNERDDKRQDSEPDPLLRAARQLPRGIAPQRDLWPGIERAIAAPAPSRGWDWNRLTAQAAAVLLLVGGSSAVTWLAIEDGQPDLQPVATATGPLEFETVAGQFGGRYHLGPEFVDARNDLAAGLETKLASLPPETRRVVEKNIAAIRASISEMNQALANEPDNALLQDLLLGAYREELSLMRKVDSIAADSDMRRTDI